MSEKQARQARAAARRTRTRTRTAKAATNGKPEETPELQSTVIGEGLPGVVVLRIPTDTPGKEDLRILPLNGMDFLAIPTLLEHALRMSRENQGLPERSK